MSLPRPEIDPDGLLEYSVVFSDRSLNHMSRRFVTAMQELLQILRTTYGAHTAAVVPGGGTAGMEAVARQLATGRRCLVVRNGWFSFRWSQIIEQGGLTDDVTVLTARPTDDGEQPGWMPPPVEEVVAAVHEQRPEVVFAAHVETASGILLPDDYVRQLAAAAHEVGALVVLDCIASGAMWVDMSDLGVDVLLSAPQKGWSGSPGTAYVLLSEQARAQVEATESSSFFLDLQRWVTLSEGYAQGRASYHATLPTDTIVHNLELMQEAVRVGLPQLRERQQELGSRVRALLADAGFPSVAAPGFEAPSVVVAYTRDAGIRSGATFAGAGMQTAAGVPLRTGERDDFSTFRIGLFGLDKWADVDGTVARLADGLDRAVSR